MRVVLFLCLLVGGISTVHAQQELLLHALPQLPQASSTNPALAPEKDGWSLSLPSIAYNYGNNAFAFGDLIRRYSDDSLVFDIPRVLSKLKASNIIQYQINADLLRLSWRRQDLFLSLLVSEKVNVKSFYSRDLANVIWHGNAPHIGDTLSIGPQVNAHYYRELSLSAGYIFPKLTVGVRGKFLAGLSNIETRRGQIEFYTDPSDYALSAYAGYRVHTSGVQNFGDNPWRAVNNYRNPGVAADVGVTYTPTPRLTLQASVNNLGKIWWSDDLMTYKVDGAYQFSGIGLNKFFTIDTLSLTNLGDSLRAAFEPHEDSVSSYASTLVPRTYLSAQWEINDRARAGMVIFAEHFGRIRPSVGVNIQYRVLPSFDIAASYAWKNWNWDNLGLAAVLRLKNFQLYGVTDNAIGIFRPRDSRSVNFRVGINLLFEKN